MKSIPVDQMVELAMQRLLVQPPGDTNTDKNKCMDWL